MSEKTNDGFYDYNRLGDLLFIFHKNHKTYLNNALAQYDLNLIQVLCMLRVYNEENLNQKDLSDSLYITKGAITKAIKKMGLDKLDDEFFKTFIELAFKSAELND